MRYLKHRFIKGFTLMELMLAMLVLVTALVSISVAYVNCFELNETSKNITLFINAAQKKMEEIKNTAFSAVYSTYNGTAGIFTPDFLPGDSMGSIFVDNSVSGLLNVTVSMCWRQKSGRIVGEDTNLNGQLDAGEDMDSDNIISSPVRLTTYISQ